MELSNAFIAQAREFLSADFLPKIERCVEKLTDEEIWWRANQESNSIGNLMLHLSGNARQWIVSGLGGAPDQRERQTEFDQRELISRSEVLGALKQTMAEVDETLARFDPGQLLTPRPIQGSDVTALEAIFHVVEHFSMHTGQIILITKMLQNQDLRFYDFSTGAPVHTWSEAQDES
jgi:uncharacterized damage-inducible protein DinB